MNEMQTWIESLTMVYQIITITNDTFTFIIIFKLNDNQFIFGNFLNFFLLI